MKLTEEEREKRRELNAALLERGRAIARERGLADPYGADLEAYERAKRGDDEYRRLEAEFRDYVAKLRAG